MGKLLSREEAAREAKELREAGKRIVFTNGCFDILHAGHTEMLQAARKLGDVLLVGLNADASVRRLKGPSRPIFNEEERAEVLCALSAVDYVVIFGEDTPYELICATKPHVLTKGGDWAADRIVGREVVLAAGGEVVRIPYRAGFSTTEILERIKSQAAESLEEEG